MPVVKSADLINMLYHSIFSPLCLVWVRASHRAHVSEKSEVMFAVMPGGLFLGFSCFHPPTDWPILYELKLT